MTNNFNLIQPLLSFEKNDFYFVQIIKRRKENPSLKSNSTIVRDFFIYSEKEFLSLQEKIIETCNIHNARAYIRLNKRNSKVVATRMISALGELLLCENYSAASKLFSSVAGEFHSDPNKKWLIDIDDSNLLSESLKEQLLELQKKTKKEPLYLEIPTKNGVHIITHPFNLQEFHHEGIQKDDIKKDCPTVLYIP